VNDLESELNEERARGRLAEERVEILKAQSEKQDRAREKRRSSSDLRPDLQMQQQIEIFKAEVIFLINPLA
jgi:hypothetical protein